MRSKSEAATAEPIAGPYKNQEQNQRLLPLDRGGFNDPIPLIFAHGVSPGPPLRAHAPAVLAL